MMTTADLNRLTALADDTHGASVISGRPSVGGGATDTTSGSRCDAATTPGNEDVPVIEAHEEHLWAHLCAFDGDDAEPWGEVPHLPPGFVVSGAIARGGQSPTRPPDVVRHPRMRRRLRQRLLSPTTRFRLTSSGVGVQ